MESSLPLLSTAPGCPEDVGFLAGSLGSLTTLLTGGDGGGGVVRQPLSVLLMHLAASRTSLMPEVPCKALIFY